VSANLPPGLTSVIVPCWNQRGFTELCFQALFRHTRPEWELILVDNGSSDDTAAYLAGVRDAAPVPVTIIANAENLGFPRAINQGLQAASGEHLVLLNNDAIVTDGWLDQLIALTRVEPKDGGQRPAANNTVGLVGPMSNYATPPQLLEHVPYRDLDQMHAFARQWRVDHRGKWFTVPKLSGFCVLMRRAVYEAIGGLDEGFGLGLFDDDDLAVRARRAGFELAVAHDLFVHHFGSRTFVGNGIDAEALLGENERRFAEKWGLDGPRGRRVALRPWSPAQRPIAMDPTREEFGPQIDAEGRRLGITGPPPHLRPSATICGPNSPSDRRPRTAKVSLTMIVKDEEDNLPCALESVRGIFDEIVVVDTGSTDRTREIAREFGAQVFEFPWIDDFAAARNAALSHATGDYAFWLDADDVVEPPEREKLRALLDGLPTGEPVGHVVRCACDPSPDGSGGETVVDHVRLFPIRDDVRWSYRVHEQIMPALRRAGIPVRWTDLIVRHTGYVDLALRGRKLDRDARILLEELKDRPDEPFVLFNLGAIASERRDWGGALTYLRRSLTRSAPSDSITRKLFALIARCHQMLGNSGAALRVCAEGLSIDPDDAELRHRKGVVHRNRGESAEAEQCWRRILSLSRPDRFCSIDQGIYGQPDPAQPGGPGRRARRPRRSGATLACGARRMPRRSRGPRRTRTSSARRQGPGSDLGLRTRPEQLAHFNRPRNAPFRLLLHFQNAEKEPDEEFGAKPHGTSRR
jgi:glycosyltransferase involved in cell wall biosynthesis